MGLSESHTHLCFSSLLVTHRPVPKISATSPFPTATLSPQEETRGLLISQVTCLPGYSSFPVKGQMANIWELVGQDAKSRILCRYLHDKKKRKHFYYSNSVLDVWTLKFEFHLIFACHKIFFFFQPLKKVATILSSQAIRKEATGWIWPRGDNLLM